MLHCFTVLECLFVCLLKATSASIHCFDSVKFKVHRRVLNRVKTNTVIIYIYIYIYMCVCVCVCRSVNWNKDRL